MLKMSERNRKKEPEKLTITTSPGTPFFGSQEKADLKLGGPFGEGGVVTFAQLVRELGSEGWEEEKLTVEVCFSFPKLCRRCDDDSCVKKIELKND